MNSCPFRFLGILCFAGLISGCGTAKVQVNKSPLFKSYPLSVAILPFIVKKDGEFVESGPAITLRKVFYNYFSYLSFSDLSLKETDNIFQKNELTEANSINSLPIKRLRDLLGVDAVIKGELLNSNNITAGVYAETWLKAKMEMIDLNTGETLWNFTHEEIDQSSLVTPNLVDMVRQQIANSNPEKAYYKLSEQFASKIVRKIPDPSKIAQTHITQPTISEIFVNIEPGETLRTGDILEVTLTGSPGLTGSFDIGNSKFALPLSEIEQGIYNGSYSISPEDSFRNALVIGRLKDKLGLTGKKALYGITLSTVKYPIQKARLSPFDNANKFKN